MYSLDCSYFKEEFNSLEEFTQKFDELRNYGIAE